jgi:hypothetical protein
MTVFTIFYFPLYNVFPQEQFIPVDIKSTGDRGWRKLGLMNGNLISSTYVNTSQVAKGHIGLQWPTGSGHEYMDDLIPIVCAEAVDVNGNVIHPLECNYEWSLDVAPDGLTEWGWQPLPGYLNPTQDLPAISHKQFTWPEKWPDRPDWSGFWNGYFGRGILNADQETYFVADDDADEEFQYFPDSTDHSRRGIGMRMSVRAMQWSHVLAEDCIFWVYDVLNVSTTDYEKVLFGMFVDSKSGGHDFDNGFYDTFIDLTYIWDQTGVGSWGGPTGWIGYGYLESPGIGDDGIDNDEDELVDENRDSGPGEYLYGPIGKYGPPKLHWSGDEDGDWNPEIDDVGSDGVGPLDENYFGPDEGEGDGIPTDGEPNFDRTDLDESDQIGLQSVSLHDWGTYPLHEDDLIWNFLANHSFDPIQYVSNIGILYSSGPFPLDAMRTERFSLVQLMGADFDDLVRNKDIVQRLGYKKDFEGYVIYKSTDPGLLDSRLISDAFGNTVFRSAEAQYDYANGIKGTAPVGLPNGAHFYLGDDTGLSHSWTDSDVVNGQTYYYAVVSYDAGDPNIGSDGLPPSESTSIIERDEFGNVFTDINTIEITPGVPSAGYQSPKLQNIPDHISGPGTGTVEVSLFDPSNFLSNHHYQIEFEDTLYFTDSSYSRMTKEYSVWSLTEQSIKIDKSSYITANDIYPFFDGLGISVFNDEIVYLPEESGLSTGQSDYTIQVVPDTIDNLSGLYPADYEIRFADGIVATSRGSEIGLAEIGVNFTAFNLTEEIEAEFLFYDYDHNEIVTHGDEIVPLIPDPTILSLQSVDYRTTWRIKFIAPVAGGAPPRSGDVFNVKVTKPFRAGDIFEFETYEGAAIDEQAAKSDLDQIKVVPNPYMVTNPYEPRNMQSSGRGDRVLHFTHLPKKCTIRIFNLRGQLVDLIDHDSTIDDGVAKWDLLSREGIDVAFGVYIYHVESEVGTKIGRFALIK